MAEPIGFVGQNDILPPPDNMIDCQALPIMRAVDGNENNMIEDGHGGMQLCPLTISCWQLTDLEIEQLKTNRGKIYLTNWGLGHPAVTISSIHPVLGSEPFNIPEHDNSERDN